ncbi:hypothetical protein MJO28_013987 [Puccinia striiformis f. sp. tritici]|uniref:Uncharacterized protein n=4 Tax=Puccinia striiformis TaxID=27350 RepID=A0A0L0W0P3_9BASI|nr:hypothetical protein Pst134EA_025507 [Puccinia striiformis f. sp. tritici]KAI9627506.1 hypothetical protein KEM48_009805 [Puccinia striiformis f. sp. tritici PST-130]KNF05093.1 hypothetical protein PSTG_01724 [Puccinia striiformis f. sp. tritici PST-78]POW04594.1 hypothetical protein PSHT_11174 [Puccinia striiformis]KAH9443746.1 hypothetical protein Pst134EB_026139 [Puccinia striiformis f. sp. tritici]KAH9451560.1 hypothetical protein Pst134EA_025507 [Puccinia striiformis f. sp. tritici]
MIFNYRSIALLLLAAASEVASLKAGECGRSGDKAVCFSEAQYKGKDDLINAKYQEDGKICPDFDTPDFARTRCCKKDVLDKLKPDGDKVIKIPRASLVHGDINAPDQGDGNDCI